MRRGPRYRFESYDHCFALRGAVQPLRRVASAYDAASGLELTCDTTLPALQLYTSEYLTSSQPPKAAHASVLPGGYGRYGGFCLEAQQYPDAPNHDAFPSAILRPGELYRHKTVYRLDVRPRPAEA